MKTETIGFIGFGLIGGSIARALKEQKKDCTILAYNYHIDIPSGLALALSDGVLDRVTADLTDFAVCDLIFLCAPVLKNIGYLAALKDILKDTCILTDVGSVKNNIQEAAEQLGLSARFIGGHPMTGSEKTGYENSYAMLLENAYYILTPGSETPTEVTQTMTDLVSSFGSLPVLLDPREHDDITAAISHLPHVIASALVNLIRTSGDVSEKMRMLAAGGFKDITRIASASPEMWENICMTNTDSIIKSMDRYIDALQDVRYALKQKDSGTMYRFFEEAGIYRDAIPNRKGGAIHRVYEIFLDIIDEAGAIATIATLLATNGISIKNIGIVHNREFEEGVLHITFYEETAAKLAKGVLQKHHYTIHER